TPNAGHPVMLRSATRRRLRATPLDIPVGQAIPGSAAVSTTAADIGREMVHLRLRREFTSSFLKSRNVSEGLAREEQAALRRGGAPVGARGGAGWGVSHA